MNQPQDATRTLIVVDRFPEGADGWPRLIRDVVGGGAAVSPLIAALDRSAAHLLEGVDVEAALEAEATLDAEAELVDLGVEGLAPAGMSV